MDTILTTIKEFYGECADMIHKSLIYGGSSLAVASILWNSVLSFMDMHAGAIGGLCAVLGLVLKLRHDIVMERQNRDN